MEVKIDDKSITTRFQVELAMKCAPRRPQDVSRRPQDAPKTPQDSQDDPKTAPRRAQDAPRTPPRTPQDAPGRPPGAENFGMKNAFLADPHHRRSQDAPRLPRRPQDTPNTPPRTPPRRPQDGARARPGRPKCPKRPGKKPTGALGQRHATKQREALSRLQFELFWMDFENPPPCLPRLEYVGSTHPLSYSNTLH